ncbi:TauD/TfdA family dioxygenase [Streptomyces sp. MI02-7b]|uniref:TauD/TfdA family dioxygenase n=1 Tax=Streptomyces sp. MI02-7b TaxID=462941 RepID=UPI0029B1CFBD|nr:TauD/TfdA family dioxygenase [Streptomyces sp. MI02-7b]MDX3078420.1 TauD/TfdA family dioxygenase [Streptomyces sp. MI02-7b]
MPVTTPPVRLLSPHAAAHLMNAAHKLLAEYGSATDPKLFDALDEAVTWLDAEVADVFRPDFAADGLFVVRGLEIDDSVLPPTPLHWSSAGDAGALWDMALLLITRLIGRPIAWQGQQNGRAVNNIVPAPGHEHEQTGASSTALLSPHTEDAFHPQRAHMLLLFCMRNHDRVATTASSVRHLPVSAEDMAHLARPVVPILPDDAYTSLPDFTGEPPAVRTLWESPDGLTLRFDPAYTPLDMADEQYREAYGRLETGLAQVSADLVLEPGDVLLLDNDVVVHGRVPFKARYDGTDRWLKRSLARIPGRLSRHISEQDEHGYGQAVIEW